MIKELSGLQLSSSTYLWPNGPRGILQAIAPCSVHSAHTPVTVINELHHIFPEYMQRRVWGMTKDQRKVSICATGHSSVHYGLEQFLRYGTWPRVIVGSTRELAELAITRYKEAGGK